MTRSRREPEAALLLEDGSVFRGQAFGALRSTAGEVVFNTGMVGYPESLTDPSYRAQILVSTYPLIGNYGVPAGAQRAERALESSRVQIQGLVISTLSTDFSHYDADASLSAWLNDAGVVGLAGIDTRRLTQRLRDRGTMAGKILVEGDPGRDAVDFAPMPNIAARNLVAEVSVAAPTTLGDGARRVVLIDCGAKESIVRSLLRRGVSVRRIPWDHDVNREDADGIVVSNGPGDPKMVARTITHLREALRGDRPILGICLGHQLLALAAGCDTHKLKFGHRSQNQPCREVGTDRCFITSQNHGYAVRSETIPEGWEPWFVNANDGSNEGMRHRERPFMSVQFHPEANPGPEDTAFLFDRFLEALR